MKTLLVGFGDSWTFGSELDRPERQSWVYQIAQLLDAEPVNMGTPASSIGHLGVQLFDFIKKYPNFEEYKIIFMVGLTGLTRYLSYSNIDNEFINITPEAVYKTSNIHPSGRPPAVADHMASIAHDMYKLVESKDYNEFIACQTIFQFQQFCNYNEIDCIFFSYFDQLDTSQYNHMLYTTTIYPETITKTLTGKEYELPGIRENEYFAGKLFHPNLLGHTRIAELLKEFYDKEYPRN